jgi:prephenate dehydratase
MTRYAYSGEPGAFAEDAVLAFDHLAEPVATPGFRDVFEAVVAGRGPGDAADAAPIERGVVPIENVVQGTVRENYDLLLEHDLVVVGEVIVPVHLCLAALPGERIETVERVYSHIQALGQAESFLRSRPWTLLTTYNTAGAGKLIVDRQEHGAAAVLSPRAAAGFGLSVLADAIQSVPDNRTRFLVLARPDVEPVAMTPGPKVGARAGRSEPPVAYRTTLVLAVKNEPGTLLRCLEVLAAAGLNMGKLESRPSRRHAWEYVFWVELDADAADPATAAALTELGRVASMVRVLGSCPRAADPV